MTNENLDSYFSFFQLHLSDHYGCYKYHVPFITMIFVITTILSFCFFLFLYLKKKKEKKYDNNYNMFGFLLIILIKSKKIDLDSNIMCWV